MNNRVENNRVENECEQQIFILNNIIKDLRQKMKDQGLTRSRGCPKKYPTDISKKELWKQYHKTWLEKKKAGVLTESKGRGRPRKIKKELEQGPHFVGQEVEINKTEE